MSSDSSSKSPKLPIMDDIFKNQPHPEIMKNHIASYTLKAKAIDLLQNTMPSKILLLEEQINNESDPKSIWWKGHTFSTEFKSEANMFQPRPSANDNSELVLPKDIVVHGSISPLDDDEQVNGVRLGMHWFEKFDVNKIQMECMEIITAEVEELHMIVQDLRIWLELEIPLIEGGNSFGAEVQNSLIRELQEVYKKCNAMTNGARAHHGDRLKLAMDWAKYPNFIDFKAAIEASDRYDHILMRSYLRTLLIQYGGLLTKFQRNWQKVINPKSGGGSGGMY